jgi:TolB-like protein/cytochrome c-type biogenesis protein CcmH/NrfG
LQFEFEGLALDTERRELLRAGSAIPVEPQVFDLLEFLVRNRHRVVSKDDLIAGVWGGRIVSDSTLSSRITAVRHAIGDSGEHQRLLRTIPRKGFRFVGVVSDGEAAPLPLPEKPSIAILPFANLSENPEQQEYFVDGVVEEIITALSQLRWLFVIARNSSFSYRGRTVNVRQIGRELGVRYVLEGSVRKAGQRVRVNVQLIDAESGGHLWADRFDREIGDLFALQDEITIELASALEIELVEEESRRRKLKINPAAFDLEMQARAIWHRGWSRENFAAANKLYDQALALDSNSVLSMTGLATGLAISVVSQWSKKPDADLARAESLAIKALALDPHDAASHYALGFVHRMQRRFDEAICELETAIRLNPNMQIAYSTLGFTKALAGRAEEGLAHFNESIRLSPRDPLLFVGHYGIGWIWFLLGDDEQAMEPLRRSIALNPSYVPARLWVTAAYAMQGRLEEAREALAAYLRINPEVNTISKLRTNAQSSHPIYLAQRERFYEGMRRSGMAEE